MNNRVRLLLCALFLTCAGYIIWPGATGGAAFQSDHHQPGKVDFARDSQPNHWAFIAPIRPPLPEVRNGAWVRTPIDSFILAEIEKAKLTPATEADKVTLIRRLSLDLTGLPPTIKEIDGFVADASPDAYEKLAHEVDLPVSGA
jgi:Protein of unknown function (DUF1549)